MSIYDTHKPAGGGMYFKIEPGETKRLRIVSEPAVFDAEQKDGTISTRYAWLIWNYDEQAVQVMQQSAAFFRTIAGLAQDEDWGDPAGYDLKIKRTGSGLETRYETNPNPNRDPLPKEANEGLAGIDLIEKLAASQFVQRPMWLEDLESGNKTVAPKAKAAPTTPPKKEDVVIDNLDDEPINLDDIPF